MPRRIAPNTARAAWRPARPRGSPPTPRGAHDNLAGLIAFYSIVHFEPHELALVMRELRKVLVPGGLALVSFHAGNEVVHVDDLFGAPVNLDFRFHAPADVVKAMQAARFVVFEHVEREPYEGAEYQSRRCYLLARAV